MLSNHALKIHDQRKTVVQTQLSNSPCKKEATTRQGMQKGANFCTTLPLFYHISDWLKQQNLPKLQVAAYLFIYS